MAGQQIEREDTFEDELEGQMYIARTNPALFRKLAAERYLKAAEMRLEELRAECGNTNT